MALTIVLPNRNRTLDVVQRTLESIVCQSNTQLRVVLVDYGSELGYQDKLKECIHKMGNVELILCPTQGQLWNKSRAINIVLQQCDTPFFMVADMDMLFHPHFIKTILPTLSQERTIYFPVGILTKEETARKKAFSDYKVKFITNNEATGITIFPTEVLRSIRGFDEFYHGWGSEDTDVHVRLRNTGYTVDFMKETLYFLHQWHPKTYRSKESKEPFHSGLELTNAAYLLNVRNQKKTTSNHNMRWGILPLASSYNFDTSEQDVTNRKSSIKGLSHFLREMKDGEVAHFVIKADPEYWSIKSIVKKALGRKRHIFLDFDTINDLILESLIGRLRNAAYNYSYDRLKRVITLQIRIIH